MIRVELYDDAEREAAAISQRYEDEQSGLGGEFLAHLDVALGEIADRPRAAAIWRHRALSVEVRRHVMRRFPYVLPFVVREDRVTVLAVAHTRRSPDYWLGRVNML